MGENADALKKGYQDFANGDMDAVMDLWQDDIRWEGTNSERIPGGGTHEGKEAVGQAIQETVGAYDEFSVTPDEFHESGDTVIVLGHSEGKAKGSGNDVKVPFVHVWRMSDGKVSRVQILTDSAVVAEALES